MITRSISKFIALAFVFMAAACQKPDATEIIDRVIELHGGELYNAVEVEFDFRDRHYKSYYNRGAYKYERHFQDSTNQVRDVLTNDGFTRTINGVVAKVTDKKVAAYSRSINSVMYFAFLPFKLNDRSVNKKYLGKAQIKGQDYHKIEVTFQEEGGGEDYEDVFIYWIHPENHTMDYLAYVYHTDGGGKRFRAPYNIRNIDGLRFADYINYEEPNGPFSIADYDSLFAADALPELSRIELENIKVAHLE
ncbi:MAG: DUF6503 family protein [Cyclobacteriaceae bacterium]